MVLVAPQPAYYMICEFIKIFGEYHDLYYPNKGAIIGQLIFIMVLYMPFFANYYMVKRMIQTNVRLIYPTYDFKTGKVMISDKKREMFDHSPSAENLTAAELDSLAPAENDGGNLAIHSE